MHTSRLAGIDSFLVNLIGAGLSRSLVLGGDMLNFVRRRVHCSEVSREARDYDHADDPPDVPATTQL